MKFLKFILNNRKKRCHVIAAISLANLLNVHTSDLSGYNDYNYYYKLPAFIHRKELPR